MAWVPFFFLFFFFHFHLPGVFLRFCLSKNLPCVSYVCVLKHGERERLSWGTALAHSLKRWRRSIRLQTHTRRANSEIMIILIVVSFLFRKWLCVIDVEIYLITGAVSLINPPKNCCVTMKKIANQLERCLREKGLALLVNHGIPQYKVAWV